MISPLLPGRKKSAPRPDSRSVQILIRETERRDQRARPEEGDEFIEQVKVGREDDETSVDEVVASGRIGDDGHRRLGESSRVGNGRVAAVCWRPVASKAKRGERGEGRGERGKS